MCLAYLLTLSLNLTAYPLLHFLPFKRVFLISAGRFTAREGGSRVRGFPFRMSAKISDFLTPPPPLSANSSNLPY